MGRFSEHGGGSHEVGWSSWHQGKLAGTASAPGEVILHLLDQRLRGGGSGPAAARHATRTGQPPIWHARRGDGWVLREGRSEIRALWRARRTDLLVGGRGGLEVGGVLLSQGCPQRTHLR